MQEYTGLLIIAGLIVVAGCVLYACFRVLRFLWQSFRLWIYNTAKPRETYPARVVSKRTETEGNLRGFSQRIDTWNYVTFEFRSGERREYFVDGNDYGLVVEGDQGLLTIKGTLFCGFERDAAP